MNEIMNIGGVDCYEKDGTAYLKLETVARGLGFTRTADSGNEVVRWERVNKYLEEIGFMPTSGHDAYIPENIFYRLAMKAKNETAEKFQAKVADEIIPAIRKHGGYLTPQKIEEVLLNPDTIINLATALKKEKEKTKALEVANAVQQQQIAELKPKADYTDRILNNKGLVNANQIAKDYGMSARTFNRILHDLGVQYKEGDQWLLYRKYQDKGYTFSETVDITRSDGRADVKMRTKWTQKGRLFLYNQLKKNGYLPMIERN